MSNTIDAAIDLAGNLFKLDDLIRRAVRNARPRGIGGSEVRWSAVGDAFAVGSTVAVALCRHYGVDPHEQLACRECERCAEDYAEEQEADMALSRLHALADTHTVVDLINNPPFATRETEE